MSYLPRGVARCQHIKVNGTRCESPALKGKAYCYFHYRSRLSGAASSPKAKSQEPKAGSQELSPAGVPLNTEFFLLEDANSVQCALQWVLRRILAASIDRRQAALLLYGLQIAASNVKQTTFEPYYRNVIRNLPATETETAKPAEILLEPAENCPDFHPERGTSEPTDSNTDCHPELGPGEPSPVRANEPAFPETDEQPAPPPPFAPMTEEPASSAQPQPPVLAQLASDNCPLATASPDSPLPPTPRRRPKRSSRRQPVTLDHQMLSSTPRAALSLMFQREVKRHLARLDFPNAPDPVES